ncbi:MAG: Gfo/Idh/MocA family oxidoreductase [Anaerolineae bacterium]|nr:Gfo/Idh/MocA family oxidoreductase [Anaerolineae bacterium]
MVKIGIIGCGGMGRYHSRSLREIEGVGIVAASDADEEVLEAYAREFEPERTYTDFRHLVRDPSVDAVLVCLPTFLHPLAVLAAAEAGKHVFCEKPIALKEADAEAMIQACERAGVHLMVGFVRRFDNDWGAFKRLVEAGAIGRPIVWRHFAASGGPRSPWYLDRDKGGGPIVDGAIHDVDFANWLFGDMAWSQGAVRRFKSTAWDTATVSIGYEGGDELVLSWTWGLPSGASGLTGQDAIGPGGSILFPGSVPRDRVPADLSSDGVGMYLLDTGEVQRPEVFRKNNMFLDEMRHFVHCCATGTRPAVTGEDGLRALRVVVRALQSAQEA